MERDDFTDSRQRVGLEKRIVVFLPWNTVVFCFSVCGDTNISVFLLPSGSAERVTESFIIFVPVQNLMLQDVNTVE